VGLQQPTYESDWFVVRREMELRYDGYCHLPDFLDTAREVR
jgi:hypothetical protein